MKMSMPASAIDATSYAVDEGVQTLKLTGIDSKFSKDRGSINWTFNFEIYGHQKKDGSAVTLKNWVNSKAGWVQNDLCHALGIPMEAQPDGSIALPGDFNGPQDEPEKWQYRGPLVGRTCKAYLVKETSSKGTEVNNIKYFICGIQDCATRFPKIQHSKDLTRKQK